MDDATRAELAELRRRAFGPEPDIADDPIAMERLFALESLVLSEHAAAYEAQHAASVSSAPAVDGFTDEEWSSSEHSSHVSTHHASQEPGAVAEAGAVSTLTQSDVAPDRERERARRRAPRRDGARSALAAAVIAAAVVAVTVVTPPSAGEADVTVETTREAYSLARDRDAVVLLDVPLDGWFGVDVDLPADEIPPFPTSGTIDWASPLGEYYGWDLWIGGATGALQDEQCILVLKGSEAKAHCVVAALRAQSALIVSLPASAIEAGERPDGLVPGRRIGFWWASDDSVTILLAAAAPEG